LSTPGEPDRSPDPANPVAGAGEAPAAGPRTGRNPWIWISAALALLAAGFLVWALVLRSDLDDSEQANTQLQSQIDQAAKTGGSAVDDAKALYDDVAQQLGVTSDALAATEQDLAQAKKIAAGATAAAGVAAAAAVKARKDADAADQKAADATEEAEQATTETDKAKAEADKADAETDKAKATADEAEAERDKATAEADLAKSKATIVAGCAKSYLSAFGTLLEGGESAKDRLSTLREGLSTITADCKTALSGT
jgi:chromosome segregation ATPase